MNESVLEDETYDFEAMTEAASYLSKPESLNDGLAARATGNSLDSPEVGGSLDLPDATNLHSDNDLKFIDEWPVKSKGLVVFDDMAQAEAEQVPAEILEGPKGGLLYKGKTNTLYGPSYSGKTFVALLAVFQVLVERGRVVFIDLEDTAATVKQRLVALGAPLETVNDKNHFLYYRPQLGFLNDQTRGLVKELCNYKPDLVAVDSYGELSTMENLKEDADGVRTIHSRILKPLAESGACVVCVDHTAKNSEGPPTEYGAMQKRAAITGASWLVQAIQKLKPCTEGTERPALLQLTCVKDRPGSIDGAYDSGDDTEVSIAFTAYRDDTIAHEIVEASDTNTPVDKNMIAKILNAVSENPGSNKSEILEAIGRNYTDKRANKILSDMANGHTPLVKKERNGKSYSYEITEAGNAKIQAVTT